LSAINVDATRDNAEEQYNKYIYSSMVIDHDGGLLEEEDAFKIDVLFQYRDKTLLPEERSYPLFKAKKDGNEYFIVPMVGSGLWGPIWGFVALEDDYNTIYGAAFNHKAETPGLGANINQRFFMDDFIGEKLLDQNENFKGIKVSKTNLDPRNEIKDDHEVDAIAGSTITGDGVSSMIKSDLRLYIPYFKKLKQN